MARRPTRGATGAWSLSQVAASAGLHTQVLRTGIRLGHFDQAALTWHDVIVARALNELGANRTTNWDSDRKPARARELADRDATVATAARQALRDTYRDILPDGPVADLWLVVGGPAGPSPARNLNRLAADVEDATGPVTVLPLSRWVAALAADLTAPTAGTVMSA